MRKALNIPLEEFLRPFFDPAEKVCLRIFDDRKTGTFKGAKLEAAAGKIAAVADTLHKHNEKHRGIYFVVNFGGHEDTEITRINAQFMECDELSLEEQLRQIEAFPLEPSLIVKTRKSLHTYWLIKDGDVAAFRRVQKRLAAQFHGDKTCVNESRVLRLPGFYHCKEEPVMVECIHFRPELRYTQTELEATLPVVTDEPAGVVPATVKGTRKGLMLVQRRCAFIQHCRNNAASLSEHDWYAMITNLSVFEGGDQVIHQYSAAYPKYTAAETQDKIDHFLASGTKPMTCRTIAEKGFNCPKLATGECGCKAPAALCFQALTVEELREALSVQPVGASAVESMAVARDFVKDYLYNIEPVVAATFLEYELREHFGIKTGAAKTLVSYHRELYKEYRQHKETRREAEGAELPDWYEPTERGGLRFISGLLANHLAEQVNAFYGAGSYFRYEGGVYRPSEDLWAAAKVREHMLPRYASMQAINDTVGQWRICYEIHQKAKDIIEGRKIDHTFYPVIYGADEADDWTDPKVWKKANPSLGITVGIDKVRDACESARQNPGEENAFRQLRLNQWVKQAVRWMPMEKWDNCVFTVNEDELEGRACYGGLDLSSTMDITAFVLVFPPEDEEDKYIILPYFWIPEDNIDLRVRRDHVPYDVWERQGYLQTTEGNVVHYGYIEKFIERLGERYNIREIAFDRWGAVQMVQNLEGMGFTVVPFGQGFKDMSPPTKELMKLVLEEKIAHGGHPVLRWMMDNIFIRTDPAGNIKPDKEKSTEKIDGAVATIMALDRAIRCGNDNQASVYDDRGLLFI